MAGQKYFKGGRGEETSVRADKNIINNNSENFRGQDCWTSLRDRVDAGQLNATDLTLRTS